MTGAKPSLAAAIASTPEPVPRSSSGPLASPARASSTSSSRHSRVVACEPGAERLTGVDHDVDQVRVGSGRMPGRAHVERPGDLDGAVEGAPARGPVVGDLAGRDLDERAADAGLQGRQARQLAGCAVEHVLDRAVVDVDLLDAGRARTRAARRASARPPRPRGDANREADHWSGCGRSARAQLGADRLDSSLRRFSGVIVARTARAARAAASLSRRGICTLTTTRRSPWPWRCSRGIPLPRSAITSPGWVPGGDLDGRRLGQRRHLEARAECGQRRRHVEQP